MPSPSRVCSQPPWAVSPGATRIRSTPSFSDRTADAGPPSRLEAGAPPLADGGADADAAPTYIWPNQVSAANSDPWIAAHHDQIVEMQPRVLLLNFANGVDPSAAQNLATQHIDAFMEASRYHGYSDPDAPAFLQYQLAKIVDLRDGSTAVNSATLPVSNGEVDYAQLDTPAFASLMGIEDPDNPGTNLTSAASSRRASSTRSGAWSRTRPRSSSPRRPRRSRSTTTTTSRSPASSSAPRTDRASTRRCPAR